MATPNQADQFDAHLALHGIARKASYSVPEAARVLGVSEATIYRMLDRGDLALAIHLSHTRRPTYTSLRSRFYYLGEPI